MLTVMSCRTKLVLLGIVAVLTTVGAFFLGREIGADRERAIYSKQLYELTEGARRKAAP
jgi:hypothetical protein